MRPELRLIKGYEPELAPASILLDANENPYGPPPEFLKAAAEVFTRIPFNRYPNPKAMELRLEAAEAYGVAPESLVFGNGSDELIQLLIQAFGGVNRTCLIPTPTFSMYRICALGSGMIPLEEPLGEQFELTEAFKDRAEVAAPSLIFLASPNSPTGNSFKRKMIEELLDLPFSVVVVDEAYGEFSGFSFLPETKKRQNLVVLRTFSKAYALAGVRLGMLCAHPVMVAELEKIRLPYNVDRVAQALGLLALKQRRLFAETVHKLVESRRALEKALAEFPALTLYPSDANFILLKSESASELQKAWLEAGIRVRSFPSDPRLAGCLRVTVGTEQENALLVETAEKVCKRKSKQSS
jgi:histidinol-phosphate aminotransferase